MAGFADKPIRRSQLITPFGVGAMVDFPRDTAVMIAGLDSWPYAKSGKAENIIYEERLQARLRVSHFRLPAEYDGTGASKIPTVRFPRWHYCPSCKTMEKVNLFKGDRVLICRHCEAKKKKKIRLIPVRFVTVCPKGHIDDFPFDEWVHAHHGRDEATQHTLMYTAGNSSTLAGIKITCTCGAWRNMRDAFDKSVFERMGIKCKGYRPWFGQTDADYGCGEEIQTAQRGASNIYFPAVYSSIYLPLWGEKIEKRIIEILEDPKIWSFLTCSLEDGNIAKHTCDAIAIAKQVDAEKLLRAATRKLEGTDGAEKTDDESFRYAEYEAFLNERGDINTDLFVSRQPIQEYDDWMADFFSSIVLVKKLRETRVLAGFTRLIPSGELDDAGQRDRLQPIKLSPEIRWLPAVIVRGEGIFIEFSQKAIDAWLKRTGSGDRIENLMDRFNAGRIAKGIPSVERDAKYFLLHTFAHALIRQLCFDCGYGSAALRERIYCDQSHPDNRMQGILIYTAAGDSEGTMGGLVRQGEPGTGRVEKAIRKALQDSLWCAADPVCIESPGQGTGSSNLAACHNCCLLPETSCEQGNRFLDRALLTGRPSKTDLGFFSDLFNS